MHTKEAGNWEAFLLVDPTINYLRKPRAKSFK